MKKFIQNYKYPLSVTMGVIALFFVFQNGTCNNNQSASTTSGQGSGGGGGGNTTNVVVAPAATAVNVGQVIQFTASGGTGPYSYQIISGGGSISSSGYFTAPSSAATVQILVTDSAGGSATAYVSVTASSANTVTVTAQASSVGTGGHIQFHASGGTPPYTFQLLSGAGGDSVTSGGYYTAGSNTGSAEVEAVDSASNTGVYYITVTAVTGKIIGVTPTNQLAGSQWAANNLLDNSGSTCYSSNSYPNNFPTPANATLYVALGDPITGTPGNYNIDHINLRARVVNGNVLAYPAMFQIQALVSGTWTVVGSYTSTNYPPGYGGSVYIPFNQTFTASQIAIIAQIATKDDHNTYYFQLCDIYL